MQLLAIARQNDEMLVHVTVATSNCKQQVHARAIKCMRAAAQRSEHITTYSTPCRDQGTCFSSMPAKQAPPRDFPALQFNLSSDGPVPLAGAAQSKTIFQRLRHQLKAGATPDADLVAAAVRAAQQSGWPSAAVVQELTSRLVSAASSCCTALRALEPNAPRGDLESNLTTMLSLLCHTLRAAMVHFCCSQA